MTEAETKFTALAEAREFVAREVTLLLVLAGTAMLLAAIGAQAQEVASTDLAEICASDGLPGSAYSRSHRLVRRDGVPGYEIDHIVPLCLGGADTEANLQLQPLAEARTKDRLERYACRAVCDGRVPLAEAQSWFHRQYPRPNR